jgi:hypothetical protein
MKRPNRSHDVKFRTSVRELDVPQNAVPRFHEPPTGVSIIRPGLKSLRSGGLSR